VVLLVIDALISIYSKVTESVSHSVNQSRITHTHCGHA